MVEKKTEGKPNLKRMLAESIAGGGFTTPVQSVKLGGISLTNATLKKGIELDEKASRAIATLLSIQTVMKDHCENIIQFANECKDSLGGDKPHMIEHLQEHSVNITNCFVRGIKAAQAFIVNINERNVSEEQKAKNWSFYLLAKDDVDTALETLLALKTSIQADSEFSIIHDDMEILKKKREGELLHTGDKEIVGQPLMKGYLSIEAAIEYFTKLQKALQTEPVITIEAEREAYIAAKKFVTLDRSLQTVVQVFTGLNEKLGSALNKEKIAAEYDSLSLASISALEFFVRSKRPAEKQNKEAIKKVHDEVMHDITNSGLENITKMVSFMRNQRTKKPQIFEKNLNPEELKALDLALTYSEQTDQIVANVKKHIDATIKGISF